MDEDWQIPCPDKECECVRCSHRIQVFDNPYENQHGEAVYRAMCTHLSPPELFEIPATEFEEHLRNIYTKPAPTARTDSAPATVEDIQRAALRDARHPARSRGRRGSGLKGSRTERMVEQLAEFKAWLRDNPVNERIAARTVGARASTYWRLHEKTFAKDATRTGEKRGFSSPKTLASAYRNSKA